MLESVIITSKPTHKKVNLTFLKPWKSHSLCTSQFFHLPKTDHKDVSPLSFQLYHSIILWADLTWLPLSLSIPRRSPFTSYHPSLLFKIMTADLLTDDAITDARKPLHLVHIPGSWDDFKWHCCLSSFSIMLSRQRTRVKTGACVSWKWHLNFGGIK